MPRIPLDHPRTPLLRLAEVVSRRRLGARPEPGLALLHNRRVLITTLAHESRVSRWKTLDPTTSALATLATAAELGCSWCLDFGYWVSFHRGVEAAKLTDITRWQTSSVYSDDDRAVIAYAIAMSRTPVEVSDEMVADLRTRFSDAQLVELTALVAVENSRSRTNLAFGLTSQGYKDSCELPARAGGSSTR